VGELLIRGHPDKAVHCGQRRATCLASIQKVTSSKSYRLAKGHGYQWHTQELCSGGGGVKKNSVEDRGRREGGSGGGSPLFGVSGGS